MILSFASHTVFVATSQVVFFSGIRHLLKIRKTFLQVVLSWGDMSYIVDQQTHN